MAEFLCRARSKPDAWDDPSESRARRHRSGAPVVVVEDGHQWGGKENLEGGFVIIRVPGLAADTKFSRAWTYKYSVEEISHNIVNDSWRFEVNNLSDKNGAAPVLLNLMKRHVAIGATELQKTGKSVRMTFSVDDYVLSNGFWLNRMLVADAVRPVSYVPKSGIHTYTIDVPSGKTEQATLQRLWVRKTIRDNGGEVIGTTAGLLTFTFDRETAHRRFVANVEGVVNDRFQRRRYRFTKQVVDAAIAAGGVLTLSESEFADSLKDGMSPSNGVDGR